MYNRKRFIALFLAAIMALSLTFSALFVVLEANHNCNEEDDCLICQQINICLHFFKDNSPDPNTHTFNAFTVFTVVLLIGAVVITKKHNTLVNLKVKLSN